MSNLLAMTTRLLINSHKAMVNAIDKELDNMTHAIGGLPAQWSSKNNRMEVKPDHRDDLIALAEMVRRLGATRAQFEAAINELRALTGSLPSGKRYQEEPL